MEIVGSTMGAVWSGGTMKPKSEVREKNSGFSGKLKSIKSFSKQKEDHRFSYPDVEVYEKKPQNYDSGELRFTISRELKPSTPARPEQNKVFSALDCGL